MHEIVRRLRPLAGLAVVLLAAGIASAVTEVSTCRVLDTPGELYRLTADLVAPNGCFSIDADGVELDGNGRTITYAASGPGNAIRVSGSDAEIHHLTIVKGPFAVTGNTGSTNANAIHSNRASIDVHDVTFTIVNDGSSYIAAIRLSGSGALSLTSNVFGSSGSGGVQHVRLEAGDKTGTISNNLSTLSGSLGPVGTRSAHVAVFDSTPAAGRLAISGNTFVTGAATEEVQGVQLYKSDHVDVAENVFDDSGGHSRMVLMDHADDIVVRGNLITMRGVRPTRPNGAIVARYDSHGNEIYDNHVDVSACGDGCYAVWFGASNNPFDLSVHDNTLIGSDTVVRLQYGVRDVDFYDNEIVVAPGEGDRYGVFFMEWDGTIEDIAFNNDQVVNQAGNSAVIRFEAGNGPVANVSLCGLQVDSRALEPGDVSSASGQDWTLSGGGCPLGGDGVVGASGASSAPPRAPGELRRTDTKD